MPPFRLAKETDKIILRMGQIGRIRDMTYNMTTTTTVIVVSLCINTNPVAICQTRLAGKRTTTCTAHLTERTLANRHGLE